MGSLHHLKAENPKDIRLYGRREEKWNDVPGTLERRELKKKEAHVDVKIDGTREIKTHTPMPERRRKVSGCETGLIRDKSVEEVRTVVSWILGV